MHRVLVENIIVKVSLETVETGFTCLATGEIKPEPDETTVFIHDQANNYVVHMRAPALVLNIMKGKRDAFFYARVITNRHGNRNRLDLTGPAPWQN